MTQTIKVAVIGVGSIGHNHARILSDLPNVDLVGVVDINRNQAEWVAQRYNTKAYFDIETLFTTETLDAVTIAVPTVHHYAIAMEVIKQGVHLLVEKPIASSIEEGQTIVSAAEQANLTLTVGHVERFNPAVIALHQHVAEGELGQVFQVEAHRASPFPAHVRDVGVVIDLAVHDLDVMRYITNAEITRIYAEVSKRVHATHEDQLIGLMRFDNDTIGKITVNWLTPTKIRQLRVLGERGMFVVNYLTQDLTFYENAAIEKTDWPQMDVLQGVKQGRKIGYFVPPKEPLRAELESFIEAIRNGTSPVVSGNDGIKAVALAEQLISTGDTHQTFTIA